MDRIDKNIIRQGNVYYVEGITLASAKEIVRQRILKEVKEKDPRCTITAGLAEIKKRMENISFQYIIPMMVNGKYAITRPFTQEDACILDWNKNTNGGINISFGDKDYKVDSSTFDAIMNV